LTAYAFLASPPNKGIAKESLSQAASGFKWHGKSPSNQALAASFSEDENAPQNGGTRIF
jgi:hypothetical protein